MRMQELIRQLLAGLGEDPRREGLLDTPKRVEKAYQFLTSGYKANIDQVLNNALFTVDYSEMVIVKDIDFYSLCEHHLLPFFGKCHVAYIPTTKVIGLSKIPRLVDVFARRLQVQERLTNQIADTIHDKIAPIGVAVVMEATHLCMSMRGVEKQNSFCVTSAMQGAFRDNSRTRMEFLELIKLRSAIPVLRESTPAGLAPGLGITRMGAALIGAALMIVTGAIAPRDALAAVDWHTLLLLLAMMAIVAPLQLAGVFSLLLVWLGARVHHPAALLGAVVFASGLLSAAFVNDTICVAFTPLVLELAAARRHDPL